LEYDDKMQKEVTAIIDWISGYAKKSEKESLVIGVSGGVDSAVVSTLCALTGLDTIILIMPIHQIAEQNNLSKMHAEWLLRNHPDNVVILEKDMTSVFDKFCESLDDTECSALSLANTRSRIRMTMLYQISSVHNGLVVGTGNRVEDFGVGFFTKYGDGGVDISPIANFMKSEVYCLAKELDIIQDIQNASPTDGLWSDGRTDEQQLGCSYNDLEWAMNFNGNESNLSMEKLSILHRYRNLHKQNLHKMIEIPIYIKAEFND